MGGRGGSGSRNLGAFFGPTEGDVISVKDYFNDTTLPVNYSLAKWKREVDEIGIPDSVYNYMNNSSINDRMKSGNLSQSDNQQVEQLKKFTLSSKLPKGTILYSGISTKNSLNLWDKNIGDVIKPGSFLSASPDPIYARGYSLNTDTMVKIINNRSTLRVGKTYYQDSTGTEAILHPRHQYIIHKKYWRKIGHTKIRIIEVYIK